MCAKRSTVCPRTKRHCGTCTERSRACTWCNPLHRSTYSTSSGKHDRGTRHTIAAWWHRHSEMEKWASISALFVTYIVSRLSPVFSQLIHSATKRYYAKSRQLFVRPCAGVIQALCTGFPQPLTTPPHNSIHVVCLHRLRSQ